MAESRSILSIAGITSHFLGENKKCKKIDVKLCTSVNQNHNLMSYESSHAKRFSFSNFSLHASLKFTFSTSDTVRKISEDVSPYQLKSIFKIEIFSRFILLKKV